MKVMAMLCPKEVKLEHGNPTNGLSDEALASMVAELEERIASRLQGENARVIDAQAEPALPLPVQPAGGSWKSNPKSSPERLAKAREYMRKRRAAAKAAKGEQQADCTENAPSLPSSGEEQLK